MALKGWLRRFRYDLVYYRPFYETVVRRLDPQTILDIGANDGHYTTKMRSMFPNASIHAFEPLSDAYDQIVKRTAGDPKVIVHKTALGEETGSTEIYRSSFHPSSSLLPMTPLHEQLYPKSRGVNKEYISIARLDDVLSASTLAIPLMIKIDVQGFEDRVIRGGAEVFKRASLVIVEASYRPLYVNQPLFGDVHDALRKNGLEYFGAVERHFDTKNRPLYEDAAFVSKDFLQSLS